MEMVKEKSFIFKNTAAGIHNKRGIRLEIKTDLRDCVSRVWFCLSLVIRHTLRVFYHFSCVHTYLCVFKLNLKTVKTRYIICDCSKILLSNYYLPLVIYISLSTLIVNYMVYINIIYLLELLQPNQPVMIRGTMCVDK